MINGELVQESAMVFPTFTKQSINASAMSFFVSYWNTIVLDNFDLFFLMRTGCAKDIVDKIPDFSCHL